MLCALFSTVCSPHSPPGQIACLGAPASASLCRPLCWLCCPCPYLMAASYQMAFLDPLSKPLSQSLASVSPFFSSFLDRLFCGSGHPQTYYVAGASHLVLLPPPPNCWITGASPKTKLVFLFLPHRPPRHSYVLLLTAGGEPNACPPLTWVSLSFLGTSS